MALKAGLTSTSCAIRTHDRNHENHPRKRLYILAIIKMYTLEMDVAVTELRAHLGQWIDAAREGNEVIITERGTPVARIVALDSTSVIDRLTEHGVMSRPAHSTRPIAGGGNRPTPKRPVADLIGEQRR